MWTRLGRLWAGIVAIAALAGVSLQYYDLMSGKPAAGFWPATVNYFSYFTVESNVLVFVVAAVAALAPSGRLWQWFRRPAVVGAACLYIGITGVVYFLFLRHLFHFQGLGAVANDLLHFFDPLAFAVYWLLFAPKSGLRLKLAAVWLAYPVAYGAYILLRGPSSGFYPYPFVDVPALGYPHVFANMAMFLACFAIAGAALVLIGRVVARR